MVYHKKEFLRRVASVLRQNHENSSDFEDSMELILCSFSIDEVYDSIFRVIKEIVMEGDKVFITGFGSFYPMLHKGHPVRFGSSSERLVPDYHTFKFSVVPSVREELRRVLDERVSK